MTQTSSQIQAWIAGAQAGQPEAFDGLIDAYAPRLYGYFYRLTGRQADAEDLLQDLFVRLVRAIVDYDHRDRFDAFIFRIAGNLFRDRLRQRKRQAGTFSLEAMEEDGSSALGAGLSDSRGAAPDASLDLAESSVRLQAAMARLPSAEREVIVLRHFSSLSFGEIAELMGTPLGTALARAHRGLNRLREYIKDR